MMLMVMAMVMEVDNNPFLSAKLLYVQSRDYASKIKMVKETGVSVKMGP